MIRSFRSKKLERLWIRNDARGIRADHLKRLNAPLRFLNQCDRFEQMNVPGWHFHALAGELKGRYAVRVTGNWRLTFAWDGATGESIDVDYEDYH